MGIKWGFFFASAAADANDRESCWLPPSMVTVEPSSLRPWFSTMAIAFFSLGDIEREGNREKEGRKRERGGDYATGDDVGQPVSLGREEEAREEKKEKKGQSRYKKCSRLRVHKKDIIFTLKIGFQIS